MGEVIGMDGRLRVDVDPALWRAKLDLNDLGNARRLALHANGLLRFIGELECWCGFTGERWAIEDGDAMARSLAQRTAEGIFAEARALKNAELDQLSAVFGPKFSDDDRNQRVLSLYGWANKSGNAERASGMLRQAQALRDADGGFAMRARLIDFDAERPGPESKLMFHCANGTLRFLNISGEWHFDFTPGHRPEDMFMRLAAVRYDAEAKCPVWEARLAQLHHDPEQRDALARIYGMCLTALTSDQAFYVFQGKGGDGKSMTNAVIAALLGDYFIGASPRTFLEGKQTGASEHQADIVRLRGDRRLVVFDEPKKGATWNGERLKQVTGSTVTARAPNAREDVTFEPRFKLIGECNNIPRMPSNDRGFRRRYKLYGWQVQYGVPGGLADEAADLVRSRLMAEASGILNWMIAGALRWLDTRVIPEPELSKRMMASVLEASGAMYEWLQTCCDVSDSEARTEAAALYASFREFCLNRGDKEDSIISQTTFGTALTEAQILRDRNAKGRVVRVGVRLKSEMEQHADITAARAAADMSNDDDYPL